MKHLALCSLVALMLPAIGYALTVQDYKDMKAKGGDGWAGIEMYIKGVGVGFEYANSELTVQHAKPLFCSPPKLALNLENYLSLLDGELSRSKTAGDTPIEAVLTYAITKAFPCGQEAK